MEATQLYERAKSLQDDICFMARQADRPGSATQWEQSMLAAENAVTATRELAEAGAIGTDLCPNCGKVFSEGTGYDIEIDGTPVDGQACSKECARKYENSYHCDNEDAEAYEEC